MVWRGGGFQSTAVSFFCHLVDCRLAARAVSSRLDRASVRESRELRHECAVASECEDFVLSAPVEVWAWREKITEWRQQASPPRIPVPTTTECRVPPVVSAAIAFLRETRRGGGACVEARKVCRLSGPQERRVGAFGYSCAAYSQKYSTHTHRFVVDEVL